MELSVHSCRLCLVNDGVASLFKIKFESGNLIDFLQNKINVDIKGSGQYSNVCEDCLDKLIDIKDAFDNFQETETRFWNLMKQSVPTNDASTLEKSEIIESSPSEAKTDLEEHVKIEIVGQPDDELSYDPDELIIEEDENNQIVECIEYEEEQVQYYDKNEPRCFICCTDFVDLNDLSNHMNDHTGLLPYFCTECLQDFEDVENLHKHFVYHSYPHSCCLYCQKQFSSSMDLHEHNKICFGYKCDTCGDSFDFRIELEKHEKLHSTNVEAETNDCDLCGKTFCSETNLIRHRQSSIACGGDQPVAKPSTSSVATHSVYASQGPPKKIIIKKQSMRKCEFCSKQFNSNAKLAEHYKKAHPDVDFPVHKCDLCPMVFTTPELAQKHRVKHQPNDLNKLARKEKDHQNDHINKCHLCPQLFKYNKDLLAHLQTDHIDEDITIYQCSVCTKTFSSEMKLEKHIYHSHSGRGNTFVCGHCGKTFSKKQTLFEHENTHNGIVNYKCELCTKEFIYKSSFERHKLYHSDARKFVCELCPKSYKTATHLAIHKRTHTGERPFVCPFCDGRLSIPVL